MLSVLPPKYYVGTCIISYMSLYFRHKYTRVLNNITINIYIEDIFYHTSIIIPEM